MPRWWLVGVVGAVALGVVVLAVALINGHDTTTTDQSPATQLSTARPSPTPTRESVPDLVGLTPHEARSVLHETGLEVLVHRVPGRGCNTTRRVVEQSNPSGPQQPVQVWVRVDALRCGLTPMLREVAQRFIDFARHDIDGVSADTPVDLYVGGRFAATIEAHQLDDPDAWRGCPKGLDGWAGRICPFSAVDPIDDLEPFQGKLQITSKTPDLPCGPVQHLARALGAYRRVAISGGSSCADSFAITLFVNDVAQIVAADIAWSEP
jgi:hypothetical protein